MKERDRIKHRFQVAAEKNRVDAKAQRITSKMQVIASLLEIETGTIKLYHPPRMDDLDILDRFSWDMCIGDELTRYGGKVIFHRSDTTSKPDTPLVRNFVRTMARSLYPSCEYEILAERAFLETPPLGSDELSFVCGRPRASSKTLLNDLLIYIATQIMEREACDAEEVAEVADSVSTPREILRKLLGELSNVVDDIGVARDKIVTRREYDLRS